MKNVGLLLRIGMLIYFLTSQTEKVDYKKKIIERLRPEEREKVLPILDKMTEQELKDVYALITAGKKITDPELIKRLRAISAKYNIFT